MKLGLRLIAAAVCYCMLSFGACKATEPVFSQELPEYYNCVKQLEHAELGNFSIRKSLTLDGAPFKPFQAQSDFEASWQTYSLRRREAGARRNYNDIYLTWRGEQAEQMSEDVVIFMPIYWMLAQPKRYQVRLTRAGTEPYQRSLTLAFQTPILDYVTPLRGTADQHLGMDYLTMKVSDLLAFAGEEATLIATVHDEQGQSTQSMAMDIAELRNGIAQMRSLMSDFKAELRDYKRACRRGFDEIVVITGRESSR